MAAYHIIAVCKPLLSLHLAVLLLHLKLFSEFREQDFIFVEKNTFKKV